jgi:alkylation response protein AidB-like acyl-CoA dehydrogenase
MSIGISDEHVELALSLRQWAADSGGIEAVRDAEGEADTEFAEVWKQAVEMGVPTIGLPEAAGGGGGSVLDQAVALEACAHALVPGPLLGVAVACALLGDTDGIADSLGAGAVVGLALDATLTTVWDVPGATHFLLPDPDDGWFLVPAEGLTTAPAIGLDLSRRFGSVDVDLMAAGVRPVEWLEAELVHRAVVTFAAAEAAGVARWCLETAVDHAKVREQFGQKIGAFQAIKHLCAEMLETAEAVTAAAWDVASVCQLIEHSANGAGAGDGQSDQWAFAVDVAAVTCFDGAVENAKACIQVLGGIGFTHEHDAHLYLRRALSLRSLVGSSDAAAERLTGRAVAGVRRRVHVDLEGRDAGVRDEVRAEADRLAALPADELRPALVDNGYLTAHWPAPYGLGADAVTQVVIDDELDRAGVVRPDIVIAGWALPTILEHGTDEQRERFVRSTGAGGCRARRSGTPSPSAPTGASAWPAPTPRPPSTRASATSWST